MKLKALVTVNTPKGFVQPGEVFDGPQELVADGIAEAAAGETDAEKKPEKKADEKK
jgi:hypothetical protein